MRVKAFVLFLRFFFFSSILLTFLSFFTPKCYVCFGEDRGMGNNRTTEDHVQRLLRETEQRKRRRKTKKERKRKHAQQQSVFFSFSVCYVFSSRVSDFVFTGITQNRKKPEGQGRQRQTMILEGTRTHDREGGRSLLERT